MRKDLVLNVTKEALIIDAVRLVRDSEMQKQKVRPQCVHQSPTHFACACPLCNDIRTVSHTFMES